MPGHHGGPSIGGGIPRPKPAPKPSSPSGFFGSMYTDPVATQGTQAMQAAQSMAQAGITGLGGGQAGPGSFTITNPNTNQTQTYTTTQNDQGGQTTTTTNQQGNIINQVSTDQQGNLVPQESQEDTNDEGKGLVETLLSNTTVANLLKGVQSTDRFFKNLSEKGVDGLTPEDKIILANLIGAGGLDTIDLNKYTTDDVDFEELGKRFTQAASGLENVDYQSLVDSYLSNKPTGIDSLTTMGSDLFNLFGDPRLRRDDATLPIEGAGSLTLEGLKKELGPEGIAYLKATNPKLYYSFTDPQTSGGLAELAQFDLSTLGGSPEDRRLAARVMAAREATSGQGGGGQTGITSIPSPQTGQASIIEPKILTQYGAFIGKPGPFIGNFVDSDGDGVDDRFQSGPGQPSSQTFQNPKAPLPGTSGIAQAVGVPAALNYANIAPQFTGYTNQGVSPMLGDYYGNLRRFYG
tara:strand:+ start:1179 stop:2567 length:1389 start_codon:yes stop_codon:yes gene_type:complete